MAKKIAFSPEIDAIIQQAEAANPDLPAGLLRAQLWQESGGNVDAVSPKKARGIAQVIDTTAANPQQGLGVNIPPLQNQFDPKEAIPWMASAMNALVKKHGDVDKALQVYNAGPGSLSYKNLPAETQGYIRSIRGLQSTLGGSMPEKDDLGASVLLQQFKVDKPAYPRGAQLKGMDALLGASKDIGVPTPQPSTEIAPEASPDASVPPSGPRERTFGQKAGRIALDVGGSLAGGALGLASPVPGGALMGAMAGSALASGLSETFDPSENPLAEAAGSAAFAGIGGVAGSALGKVLRPGVVREGGKELAEIMTKQGLRAPVPTQYFDSNTLELLTNVGKASFIGAGTLDDAMRLGTTAARDAAQQYAQQVSRSLQAGAQMMDDVAKQTSNLGLQVDVSSTRNALKALAAKYPGNAELQSLNNQFSRIPGKTLPFNVTAEEAVSRSAAAAGMPGVLPKVSGAQDLASQLRKVIRESSDLQSDRLVGLVQKNLDDAMETSLQSAAKKGGPADLLPAWKAGRALYREGIQGREITDILNKSIISGGEAGEISGKALMNQLKPQRLEALKTQLEPTQIENLKRIGRALEAAEGPRGGALTFVTNGAQLSFVLKSAQTLGGAAALGSAATGIGGPAALIGSGLVALTPGAIAKILSSESLMKTMLALSRLPPESAAAGRLTTQLLSQMGRENLLTPEQGQSSGQTE